MSKASERAQSSTSESTQNDSQSGVTAMAITDPMPIPNVTWFARGYDLLKLDLFQLSTSASQHQVFDLDSTVLTDDGTTLIPEGAMYLPPTGGSVDTSETFLMTAYDTQETTSKSASVSIGTPVAAGSLSASYTDLTQESGSEAKMETYTEYHVCSYQLSWDFAHENQIMLDADFSDDVLSLPLDGVTYDDEGVTAIDNTFSQFIELYGTHFPTTLTLGGQAYQRIQIENETLSTMASSEVDIAAEASGTFKGITGGGSYSESESVFESSEYASGCTVNSVQWNGGTSSTDLDAWAATVSDNPVPVMMELASLSDLVVPDLFSDSDASDLNTRQQLLSDAIDFYIKTNGKSDGSKMICFGDTVRLTNKECFGRAIDASPAVSLDLTDVLKDDTNGTQSWILRNAADLDSTDRLLTGNIVVLESVMFPSHYLSMDDGSNGLPCAGVVDDPNDPGTQWKLYSALDNVTSPQFEGRFVMTGDEITLMTTKQPDHVLIIASPDSFCTIASSVVSFSNWGMTVVSAPDSRESDSKYDTIEGSISTKAEDTTTA